MNLFITLFIEFFKTGLFSIGGGLATIPFLYDMIDTYHWFTPEMLTTMIAVSESTPGAMGVNMATYVGYVTTSSIFGGITTTLGLVAPSIIIICIIARYLKRFKQNLLVQRIFTGLRPGVTALIASAGIGIFITTMFKAETLNMNNFVESLNLAHLFVFFVILIITRIYKKNNPILVILSCACIGILFSL